LVGVKAGDSITVQLTFPVDYGAKDLAGKAASFAVAVKEVRVPQTVAVDDELAKRMGLENLAALRKAVSDQIARDYTDVSRARLKRALLDKLAEQHSFVVPQGMIDAEIGAILQQFRDLKEKGGLDPDEKEKTEDQVREEYRPIAERRVRLGLLLGKVGEMNNITVNDNEVSRALSEQARRFPGRERQVIEFYQNNAQAMAGLKAPLYEDKVVAFILELAKVSERAVAREELLRDPDAETAAVAAG
jgi:trigger factor